MTFCKKLKQYPPNDLLEVRFTKKIPTRKLVFFLTGKSKRIRLGDKDYEFRELIFGALQKFTMTSEKLR
jgi:hypothetical protein